MSAADRLATLRFAVESGRGTWTVERATALYEAHDHPAPIHAVHADLAALCREGLLENRGNGLYAFTGLGGGR